MVSPAAEKFLGAPSSNFWQAHQRYFSARSSALRSGPASRRQLAEIAAETDLQTIEGPRRVGVSVQGIQEEGDRMGALVTLRDLDSIESINTQLQVSERLSALGRITAGVAHEVKNPLNSMRLWLENLKEALPAEMDSNAMQAVTGSRQRDRSPRRVVKRFLDFTRPMEIRLEATQLADIVREVIESRSRKSSKAKVEVAQLLPIDVPEVYVDRALLKQAILNLVLNAVEAMPAGGQLHLMLSRRGEMAEISVGDTGKGIPPRKQTENFSVIFHNAARAEAVSGSRAPSELFSSTTVR